MKNILITLTSFLLFYSNTNALSLEWAVKNGGVSRDEGRSITYDKSGNIIITGYFNNVVDFNPGAEVFNLSVNGDKDVFIQKLKPDGSFIWAKRMGNTFDDASNQVKTDIYDNIYTVGHFETNVDFDPNGGIQILNSLGAYDAFIQKLDANGNLVWAKKIGSTDYDDAKAIEIDALGNVYVAGYFNGTVDFDPGAGVVNFTSNGAHDMFILKLDINGNFVWAKKTGGVGYDIANSICSDALNNIYITGFFEKTVDFDPNSGVFNLTSNAGTTDVFIQKIASNGTFVWAKSVGGSGIDGGSSISKDKNNNVYITGGFYGTVDFDPNAGTNNLTSNGNVDVFVLKLTAKGNFVWAKKIGGLEIDFPTAITIDIDNNIHLTGYFERTADFDPGVASYVLNSAGKKDIFFEKLNQNGEFMWAYRIGNKEDELSTSIAVDQYSNIYLTGSFNSKVDFNPFTPILTLNTSGTLDIFSLKINNLNELQQISENQMENSIDEKTKEDIIKVDEPLIYPNPFQSALSIQLNNPEIIDGLVNIYFINGQLVKSIKISGSVLLETTDWKEGVYILEIITEEKIVRKKIVKN